jgi:hypothetical protein
MPGLDPGIHSVAVAGWYLGHGMDCRVKPGNDDKCWGDSASAFALSGFGGQVARPPLPHGERNRR